MGKSQGESYINRGLKKVIVFGGAGFIGTNICNKLLDKNFLVTSFDNFSSGNEKNFKNIDNANFTSIEGDICQKIS